jgi:hypothetical protein
MENDCEVHGDGCAGRVRGLAGVVAGVGSRRRVRRMYSRMFGK